MTGRYRLMVSGPMTGLADFNYPQFCRVARRLRSAGFAVENPAENAAPSAAPTWSDWMRLSLAQLLRCHGLVMLPGWWKSRGALVEWLLAKALGLHVYYPRDMRLLESLEWANQESEA